VFTFDPSFDGGPLDRISPKSLYLRMRKHLFNYFTSLLTFGLLTGTASAQCLNCGTGSEGAFNATVNTTITGGVHNYTTFSISPGVTVRATGTIPLEVRATGAVNIQGTLDVSGLNGANGVTYVSGGGGALGVAGGGNGGAGSFASGTGPINGSPASGTGAGGIGTGWCGGGGAGYATVGASSGGVGGIGGSAYGVPQLTGNTTGSGGGGGSGGYDCGAGGGGAGGGFVLVSSCVSITITGMIDAHGGAGGSDGTGNCGGGGGGSGGSIWLQSPTVVNNGNILATGGVGGASQVGGTPYFGTGANGSVGRIRLDVTTLSGSGTANPATGFTSTPGNGPLVSITSYSDVSCFGGTNGTASATASGGTGSLSYNWTPAGGNAVNATGLAAGCYTLHVTDSVGCESIDSVCIAQPTSLSIGTSASSLLCNGDCNATATATVTGGTTGYSYLWSSGATTNIATNLCAGTTTVMVSDSNGCEVSDTLTISEPSALNFAFSATPLLCFGDCNSTASVNVSGGTPGYSYLWSTGATLSTIGNLCGGSYTVSITDANGCNSNSTFILDSPTAISLGETHTDATTATSNDGSGTVTASGGTPGYSFLWIPGGIITATAGNLAPGTYNVAVTDSNGCSDTITVIIGVGTSVADGEMFTFGLYPNPASSQITLNLKQDVANEVRVVVIDINGKAVSEWVFAPSTLVNESIDLHELPAGVYIFSVSAGGKQMMQRVAVQ
jgi:Secretion system C-terminal sorting domain/SprB repeat